MDDLRFVIGVDDRDLIRSQKEQKKFERNILTIESAFRKNQITSSRYTRELNKQASSLAKLGGTYKQANSEVRKYAASVRKLTDDKLRMAQATNMAGKSTNRFGMYAQQVGYQVGDFFVQVQSGTSALVAFGQQGTQLAGLLPGVAGAVIGISLAVGTMLARSFMEASGEAATLEEAIEKASDALSDYNDAIDEIVSSPVNGKLSETARHFIEIEKAASAIAKIELFKGLEQAADKMEITAGFFEKRYDMFMSLIDNPDKFLRVGKYKDQEPKTPEELSRNLDVESLGLSKDLTVEIYDGLLEGYQKALKSKNAKEAVSILKELYTLAGRDNTYSTKAGDDFLASIKEQSAALKTLIPELNIGSSVAGGRGQDPKRFTDRYSASNKLESGLSKVRQKETDAENKASEQRKKNVLEHIALFRKVQAEKIEAIKQEQYAGYQGRRGAKGPTKGQVAEMGMGPQDTGLEARLIAEAKLNDLRDKSLDKMSLQTQEQLVIQGLKDRELLVAQQFNETYKLQLKLSGLQLKDTDAQYIREMELLATKQQSVLVAYDQAEAQDKLNKKLEEQDQLRNSIEASMEQGFMSMVDGTASVKDAFKAMAADIIKELYRVLVVKKMVAAISDGLPFADGGVISNGSQVQAYANGGVVGGPTTFAMSGGKTGLMGEAGPEAIMPLKRGANGKLGVQMEGGGATTVVQNFNFSANGDDSVKRIIAQAAPKIAQMTKSEIMNDRRRGGAMKATFG